jgi:hypothetical protein
MRDRYVDRTVSYDTNNDTNTSETDVPSMEVVEEMVGSWGLEPQASKKRS